ncbi:hypothetical protein PVAND_009213 [Polypedilum vanderplanki]|uniref:Uncharacterized protein n=1 Tax=Polypedilum vanderplanki TaxID=319348 RepID=A0A9J6CC73_POLVA|nr:hypothetical protein PVAND_009213 [Polypedilum vanderplanki]
MEFLKIAVTFVIISVVYSKEPGLENTYLVQKLQDKRDLPLILNDIQAQLKAINQALGINTINTSKNTAGIANNINAIASNTMNIAANNTAIKSLAKALLTVMQSIMDPLKKIAIAAPLLPFFQPFLDTLQTLV